MLRAVPPSGAPVSLPEHSSTHAAAATASPREPANAAVEKPEARISIRRFEDLIALAAEKRDLGVKLALERDVRLVRCDDGRLEIRLEQSASRTLINDLARKLSQWTNRVWSVVASMEEGQPTLKSQDDARRAELKTGVRSDPLVQAVLERFPGAEIVDVRPPDRTDPGQQLQRTEDIMPELAEGENGPAFGVLSANERA
jgi:DNA polymerase-3 subunit gamma/tau